MTRPWLRLGSVVYSHLSCILNTLQSMSRRMLFVKGKRMLEVVPDWYCGSPELAQARNSILAGSNADFTRHAFCDSNANRLGSTGITQTP